MQRTAFDQPSLKRKSLQVADPSAKWIKKCSWLKNSRFSLVIQPLHRMQTFTTIAVADMAW